jgi:hypothetical protein
MDVGDGRITGAGPERAAASWRELGRRAVRIARQSDFGRKAVLVGLGALGGAFGGALFAARPAAPPRAGPGRVAELPAPVGPPALRGPGSGEALVWVVVRIAFSCRTSPTGAWSGRGATARGWPPTGA